MARKSDAAFEEGDFVVYPTHGVGRILGTEQQIIAGMEMDVLIVRFEQDRMTLRVPLEKARSLIRDTDLSIVEVSMMCGFSSASHFSTSYRSHFGLTPRHERGRSTSVESAPTLTRPMAIQTRLD